MLKEIEKSKLLKLAGDLLNSMLEGLDQVDPETKKKIMELWGETCGQEEVWGSALNVAKRIAEEETDEKRRRYRGLKPDSLACSA